MTYYAMTYWAIACAFVAFWLIQYIKEGEENKGLKQIIFILIGASIWPAILIWVGFDTYKEWKIIRQKQKQRNL